MINISQLSYAYQEQSFYFDLHIKKGSIVAILGASGAGKSTLLSLLGGFIVPTQGDILINKHSILSLAPHQRPLAILFQEHNLFMHLSVYDNIALGLHPNLKLTKAQQEQLEDISQQVEVTSLLARFPEQLSGGQKQRVALARSFVQNKPILLLDEPFSALDPLLRISMLNRVKRMACTEQITVLMVTHHLADARAIASDFIFIDQGRAVTVAPITCLNGTHDNKNLVAFLNAELTIEMDTHLKY